MGAGDIWGRVNIVGHAHTDRNSILRELHQHFQTLYSSRGTNQTAINHFLQNVPKTLTPEQKQWLDRKIDQDEVRQAIRMIARGRAPGPNGLTIEFFHAFSLHRHYNVLGQETRTSHHCTPGLMTTRGLEARTWNITFSLSSGAVTVLETAPAAPPARRIRHHRPVCFSSSVNSSGTDRVSPISINCKHHRRT